MLRINNLLLSFSTTHQNCLNPTRIYLLEDCEIYKFEEKKYIYIYIYIYI